MKPRNLTRLVAVLLAFLMLPAMGALAQSAEPFEFSATVIAWGGDDDASMVQQEWLRLMEEKMGRPIKVNYTRIPSSEYDERARIMLNTDSMTDFMTTPLFHDVSREAEAGMLLDFSQYDMPNYQKFIEQTPAGESLAYNAEGKIYRLLEGALPRFEADKGMLPNNMMVFNATVFEENNIEIPSTLEGVVEAARKLKEIYPDSFPINTRWNNFNSVYLMHHVYNDIYWDGEVFRFGVFDENYKKALQFLNMLYTDKLLDPEYSLETDDTVKSKLLNRKNFIGINEWFTAPGDYTRAARESTGDVFAVTLYPDTKEFGKSWQSVQNVNSYDLSGWGQFIVDSNTKDPETLVKFLDLQYAPDVIELITWGIKDVTYTVDENGNRAFIDEIAKADDPFTAGDKYGMRASAKHRPGLQMASDSSAYVAMARQDYVYYDGKVHEEPLEKSPYLTELPYPNPDYMPANFDAPKISFTVDQGAEAGQILTPIATYRDEMFAKFVKGEESFDNWDAYIENIRKMGDIDKVLTMYNDAAQAYLKQE
ncbi:MAG: extracellular solute-binding protein [Clostridiales bacterium]|nr:extracellular solute-binding protein [Clostridiales bacterium]